MGLPILWSDDTSAICISVQLTVSPPLLQHSGPWSHKNAYCSSACYEDFTGKGTTPHPHSLGTVHCTQADGETEARGDQRVAISLL